MVFLSFVNFVLRSGYDRSFKRQKVFKLTAKYFGRRRNCYRIAIRFLNKALTYTTATRKVKPQYIGQLKRTRIDAACVEHGLDYYRLKKNLIMCHIDLGNSELQDLAIWEPRTFKCLTDLAKTKEKQEASPQANELFTAPKNVITRGML